MKRMVRKSSHLSSSCRTMLYSALRTHPSTFHHAGQRLAARKSRMRVLHYDVKMQVLIDIAKEREAG
jgi:hypothetical protein